MECSAKVDNHNCGKCKISVLSTTFVVNKDIAKVTKVASKILWMKEFEESSENSSAINAIYSTCNDTLTVSKPNKEKLSVSVAIYFYCKLIKNWYNVYSFNKQLDSYKYIRNQFKEISKLTSISKLRTKSISISKYIESITVCNGQCTTVVPGKEVSTCRICLSDINKIVKFSSEGLVDFLDTIFYTIKDASLLNLTIDLDTTYVCCNGNIVMNRNFVSSKSTLGDMKAIYTYYLSAWCSANICKESEVMKIRDNIKRVNTIKYMHEMYDLSTNLLDILHT